jgi:NADPH-dependent 2,4-dienoyl-CoA reductase/sulfur reductase-like enzyme
MHIVIIGNGISGISCARYLRKLSDYKVTVISGESPHFFSRTALMYIYMGHMRYEDTKPYEDWFWEKNKIDLLHDWVESVNFADKKVHCKSTGYLSYDVLVIASGSKTKNYDWQGQELKGVQGLYSLQDLELLENISPGINGAAVVGGGLIGVELAEMLHSRGIRVDFLIREKSFWGNILSEPEGKFIEKHMADHGIQLHLSTELKSIHDQNTGHVQNIITSTGSNILCQFVGISTGVTPNIQFLESSNIETAAGVLIDLTFRTNIPDVYAIGDCAEFKDPPPGRNKIEQLWYTGKLHGITCAYNICGKEVRYDPGPMFNSAKFFDIEFQSYGDVPRAISHDMDEFWWHDSLNNKAIRIVWDKTTGIFLGINSFGIRFSHELMDSWLREKQSVRHVVQNLEKASFETEFHKTRFSEIVNRFFQQKSQQ